MRERDARRPIGTRIFRSERLISPIGISRTTPCEFNGWLRQE